MPKPKAKIKTIAPLEERAPVTISDEERKHYKKLAAICMNPDATVETLKAISCKFFRGGNCPACMGCDQDDAMVQECAASFATNIVKRPMPIWTPAFQELKSRPKASLYDLTTLELNCDNCYVSSKCPVYEANSTCGIDWTSLDTFDKETRGIDFLIELQKQRIVRASKFEEMDGGIPDDTLSKEMDRMAAFLKEKADMGVARVKLTAEASVPAGGKTPSGGSIFSSLFGAPAIPAGASAPKEIEAPTIDITHTEVKVPEKERRKQ